MVGPHLGRNQVIDTQKCLIIVIRIPVHLIIQCAHSHASMIVIARPQRRRRTRVAVVIADTLRTGDIGDAQGKHGGDEGVLAGRADGEEDIAGEGFVGKEGARGNVVGDAGGMDVGVVWTWWLVGNKFALSCSFW